MTTLSKRKKHRNRGQGAAAFDAIGPDAPSEALELERTVREIREIASTGGRRTPKRRARTAVRQAMTDQTAERIDRQAAGGPAVTVRAARLTRVVRTIGTGPTAHALGISSTLIEAKLTNDRLPVLPPVERRLTVLEFVLDGLQGAGLQDGEALRTWLRAPRSRRGASALDLIADGHTVDTIRRLLPSPGPDRDAAE